MTKPVVPEGYVKVSAAARLLECSDRAVRGLFDRGELAGTRSASGYRLIEEDGLRRYRPHLSVNETARRLGISTDTVRQRFDAGELVGYRTAAGARRIDPESLGEVSC